MSTPKLDTEETRADLEREVAFYLTVSGQMNLHRFINVYGAARELKGHVGACQEQNETPDLPPKTPTQDYKCPDGSHHSMTHNWGPGDIRELHECSKCGATNESVMLRRQASKSKPQRCGDDWYCDKAEAIRAQGKLRL